MGCACTKPAAIHGSTASPKATKPGLSNAAGKPDAPFPPSPPPVVDDHHDEDGAPQQEKDAKKRRKAQLKQKENLEAASQPVGSSKRRDRRLSVPAGLPKQREGEQVAAGWPAWLSAVAGEAINGWIPRRADSFEKLDKIGQGTYSNVYKARDLESKKIVALKKVRFDNLEPESVRFMAREILVLRRLDHPNVVKLEGLVTSRMSCSLYLVFEYMEHDLAGLAACSSIAFTEPQVKCYMQQLLSGLDHCHTRHVLHRDIKGSNLLLDNSGVLKIADFGLATFFHPDQKQPLTSRVVTLWYRPPELLLGATEYGEAVDLWSTGCILAELFAGKPILAGRTEVEQLHKIFKLCGSPSEDYWKKLKVPHATMFKFQQPYKRCIGETFKDFPASALWLLERLFAIEPAARGTAASALNSEFFSSEPHACDPSTLPKYPPSKEMDAKLRDEEAKRQRAGAGRSRGDVSKRVGTRERTTSKAIPAPEANAELQANLQRRRAIAQAHAKSKSEKFPPAHEDGVVGFPIEPSQGSSVLSRTRHLVPATLSGPMGNVPPRGTRRKKRMSEDVRMAPPRPPVRGSSKGVTMADFSVSGDFSNMASLGVSKGTMGSSNLKTGERKHDDDQAEPSMERVHDPTVGSVLHGTCQDVPSAAS